MPGEPLPDDLARAQTTAYALVDALLSVRHQTQRLNDEVRQMRSRLDEILTAVHSERERLLTEHMTQDAP